MPHGLPDWGLVGPRQTAYGLDDVGEAVARLASPDVWDRRGDVILIDDFRNGLNAGSYTPTGGNSGYGLVNDPVLSPPYALRLTTGNEALDRMNAVWYIVPRVQTSYGFEVWFTIAEESSPYYFDLNYYDGVDRHHASIRITVAPFAVHYLDQGGVYRPIAVTPVAWASDVVFHVLKLVADMQGDMYERLIFDGNTYGLSTYAVRVTNVPTNPHVNGTIVIYGDEAHIDDSYIDRVILTQNEPT